ncbi:MAG TPA: adenosylcobinamide amidohydrolase [Methanocella sp.]|nr:adenosylcobinamide amidohydrolase [Methanocella sp.]
MKVRYYVKDNTLVIKGNFDGISTGINGGREKVRSAINHEVGKDFNHPHPTQYMNEIADALNADRPYFGFMTAVHMKNLCIVRDPLLTAFITAGISNPCHDPGVPGTINILIIVHGRMEEGALAGAIITATEAKTKALFEMGFDFTGTTTDAVAVLTEPRETGIAEPPTYEYSGTCTEIGRSIYRCVKKGVIEGIKRQHRIDGINHKSRLFVLAEGKDGQYWIEYPSEKNGPCPYYPCHVKGQICTHCFCPLYPCEDKGLGEWVMTGKGYPVWGCKDCMLLHHREAVEYLAKHPESDVKEIKAATRRKYKGEG